METNQYLRAAWLYALGAFVFFIWGLIGGEVIWYGFAALWAFNSYRMQRYAWKKEDRDRASDGADGEGSDQDGG